MVQHLAQRVFRVGQDFAIRFVDADGRTSDGLVDAVPALDGHRQDIVHVQQEQLVELDLCTVGRSLQLADVLRKRLLNRLQCGVVNLSSFICIVQRQVRVVQRSRKLKKVFDERCKGATHIVPNVVVSSSGVQDRDSLTARDVLNLGRHFARFTAKQKISTIGNSSKFSSYC
uniref:(northern house mosquito) hypothetical protein n=1 Tax=Culex pipiens TaxID=7175 RepID=A0A8D8FNX8_CULPI